MTTRMTKVVTMTMSYSDLPAKSGSVLMRSVAFGDYHNEMTKVTTRMMTMVRTRTKTIEDSDDDDVLLGVPSPPAQGPRWLDWTLTSEPRSSGDKDSDILTFRLFGQRVHFTLHWRNHSIRKLGKCTYGAWNMGMLKII